MPSPQLRSVTDWLWHIFYGICMGTADLIPGVSGGTMAFILGFYEDLITSIKQLPRQIAWSFLTPLFIGVFISFVTFARLIHEVLGDETSRTYLYSAFFGLILGSVYYCFKHVKKWHFRYVATFAIGVVIAFLLTSTGAPQTAEIVQAGWINGWLILCGIMAVCAMLLPGISGSYMLVILGMYPTVIAALADFLDGLKAWTFPLDSFFVLANVGAGIVIGGLLFSRVISYLLKHRHQSTISMLIGFMVGALPVVWPFWTYQPGPNLIPIARTLPEFSPELLAVTGVVLGAFLIVLAMEALVAKEQ